MQWAVARCPPGGMASLLDHHSVVLAEFCFQQNAAQLQLLTEGLWCCSCSLSFYSMLVKPLFPLSRCSFTQLYVFCWIFGSLSPWRVWVTLSGCAIDLLTHVLALIPRWAKVGVAILINLLLHPFTIPGVEPRNVPSTDYMRVFKKQYTIRK